jgi:phage shock protein PspC (stress-responsive transcriptional regulator)
MITTQTIKIGTQLIHIDSDAFLKIQQYLDTLKAFFAQQESGSEIFIDIENRVGEIMTNQLKSGKASIAQKDVAEIISRIGTYEDLGIEPPNEKTTETQNNQNFAGTAHQNAANQNTANQNTSSQNITSETKLVRLVNDKILSGLCAGIAKYLKVDPVWVRLATLALAFTGFGILIYVLAAIFVPKSYESIYNQKRLMRSWQDKKIGGVCSGIGQYLQIKPLNVRLVFLLPLIITIISSILDINVDEGAFFGTSVLAYLALWVIMPLARTSVEKLEMRGAPVNANSIRNEVYGATQSNYNTTSFSDPMRSIVKAIAYVFLGFFILMLLSFSVSFFVGGLSLLPYTDYFVRPGNQIFLAYSGWIMAFLTPLVWVISMVGFKLSGDKVIPNWLHKGAFFSIVLGIISLIILGVDIAKDFKRSSVITTTDLGANNVISDSLIVLPNAASTTGKYFNKWTQNEAFEIFDDSILIQFHSIDVQPSPDNQFHYKVEVRAFGKDDNDVQKRMKALVYNPIMNEDTLNMPNGFTIKKGEVYRGQQAICTIFVPAGKRIKFADNFFEKVVNIGAIEKRPLSIHIHNKEDFRSNIWYTMSDGALVNNGIQQEEQFEELEEEKRKALELLEEVKEETKRSLGEAKDEAERALDEAKQDLNNLEDKAPNKGVIFEKAQIALDSIKAALNKFEIEKIKLNTDEQEKALEKLRIAEEKLKGMGKKLDSI